MLVKRFRCIPRPHSAQGMGILWSSRLEGQGAEQSKDRQSQDTQEPRKQYHIPQKELWAGSGRA